MNYNKNIITEKQKKEYALLVKQYPEHAIFKVNTPYQTDTGPITLRHNLIRINSNSGKYHYRAYSPHISGAQASALISKFGFKIKEDGSFHILGEKRNKPAKFLKRYDSHPLTKVRINNEQECLALTGAKTKPITRISKKVFIDGYVAVEKSFIISQDYIDEVDGRTALEKNKYSTLNPHELVMVFLEACSTIKTLHDNNIVHADLKPDNLMANGKVIDFGLSHDPKENYCPGSYIYLPPELLKNRMWSKSGDIFSLALAFIDILSQGKTTDRRFRELSSDKYSYIRNINNIPINTKIIKTSNTKDPKMIFFELLHKMLDYNPSKRPTIDDCIKIGENILPALEIYNNLKNIKELITPKLRSCHFFKSTPKSATGKIYQVLSGKKIHKLSHKEAIKLSKKCFSIIWYDFENHVGIPSKKTSNDNDVKFDILDKLADSLQKNHITHAKINNERITEIVARIKSNITVGSAPSSPSHHR